MALVVSFKALIESAGRVAVMAGRVRLPALSLAVHRPICLKEKQEGGERGRQCYVVRPQGVRRHIVLRVNAGHHVERRTKRRWDAGPPSYPLQYGGGPFYRK